MLTLGLDLDEAALAVGCVSGVGASEINLLRVGFGIDGFVALLLREDFLPWRRRQLLGGRKSSLLGSHVKDEKSSLVDSATTSHFQQ